MPHRGEQRLLITTSKRHKGDLDLVEAGPQAQGFPTLATQSQARQPLQSGLDLLVQLSPPARMIGSLSCHHRLNLYCLFPVL